MSSQRINLYQDHLHPRKELFSARNLALMAVLLLVLLTPPTWWIKRDLAQNQARVKALLEQEQALSTKLAEMAIKYPSKGPDVVLENKLQQLGSQREMAEKAITLLNETRDKHSQGFSNLLDGFARAKQQGVWLTRIGIKEGGEELSLRGESQQASLLPPFVESLKNQSVFSGRSFRFLDAKRNDQERVVFLLRSQPPTPEEQGEETQTDGGLGTGPIVLVPPTDKEKTP